NPTGRLTVKGALHLQADNDYDRRLDLGYFMNETYDYSFINSLDYSARSIEGKNLCLNSRVSGDAWGNVGIGPLNPIQALDMGGRLNVRYGVIQNGTTAITNTEDLGLYSQISGRLMRFVTNQGDINFFTDGNVNHIGSDKSM